MARQTHNWFARRRQWLSYTRDLGPFVWSDRPDDVLHDILNLAPECDFTLAEVREHLRADTCVG